ncbi:MAG: putative ABC transport system permease protein [Alteromonadaceae bacterium]|jgi:putative ABC transport system permease protein
MVNSINIIPLTSLSIAFIPVAIALYFLYRWSLNTKNAFYAIIRMLVQLLIVGNVLGYIFHSDSAGLITIILVVMVLLSSWIALNTIETNRIKLLVPTIVAITIGGGFTLLMISQGVLQLTPWYQPQVLIPLAGMIFANAMNSVSICAERLFSELKNNTPYVQARNNALNAASIPVVNSLFAVGIVSLPGMMTGQILSGVSPLIAARYQIMVMCMIFASAIISSVLFLILAKTQMKTLMGDVVKD